METTILPSAERTPTVAGRISIRRRVRARHPAPHTPVARPEAPQDLRTQVAEAFRGMANGVDGSTAEEQTRDFYRSGGQEWSRALGEQSGSELKARVIDAFRRMAHGTRDAMAYAKMLQFYRLSGQAWAKNLG